MSGSPTRVKRRAIQRFMRKYHRSQFCAQCKRVTVWYCTRAKIGEDGKPVATWIKCKCGREGERI